MNGLVDSFGLAGGVTIAVISAIFAYTNRDRYKTLIKDIYEPGNKELREQIATCRAEIAELVTQKATLETANKEKDSRIKDLKELNSNLPDYASLNAKTNEVITAMSNNHKDIVQKLTELAKAINGRT